MSDSFDVRKEIGELKALITSHVSDTRVYMADANAYRKERDKVMDAIVKTVWGNGEPGLDKKVDRLQEIENNRKWAIRAIVTAIIAGIIDRFTHH